MAELADAEDLKSSGAILVGSSPSPGTSTKKLKVTTEHDFSKDLVKEYGHRAIYVCRQQGHLFNLKLQHHTGFKML